MPFRSEGSYSASLNWVTAERDGYPSPPLGEVSYDPITNARPWFSGHCPIGPPGPDNGGVVLGGSAAYHPVTYYVADGGVVLGGSAAYHPVTIYHAIGGVVIGGTSPPRWVYYAIGGVVLGGTSPPVPPPPPHPAAGTGVVLGGTATHQLHTIYTAAGGVVLGGTATHVLLFSWDPTGGVVLGGTAMTPLITLYYADGGVVLGGSAVTPLTVSYQATGGVVLGGSAVTSLTVSYQATGGVVVGGADPLPTSSIIVDFCGGSVPNVFCALLRPVSGPWGNPPHFWLTYSPADGHWHGKVNVGGGYSPLLVDWSYGGGGEGGMILDCSIPAIPYDFPGTPLGGSTTCDPFTTYYHFPEFNYLGEYPAPFYYDVTISAGLLLP
jgi:hypothetical protein